MKPGMRRPAAWALGAVLLVAVESGCRRGRSEPAMPAKPMRYEEAPAPLPEGTVLRTETPPIALFESEPTPTPTPEPTVEPANEAMADPEVSVSSEARVETAGAWAPDLVIKARPVTFDSLLDELTDLERLALPVSPPYRLRRVNSRAPDAPRFGAASLDPAVARGHVIERVQWENAEREWVLMDAEGPGALVRFWMDDPAAAGTVRILLDGAETRIVEMPAAEFFSGERSPFIAPIVGPTAGGWTSWAPIPFASHCRVTVSQPPGHYELTWREYDEEIEVWTMPDRLRQETVDKLLAISTAMAAPGEMTRQGGRELAIDTSLEPGDVSERILVGSGAIRRLELKVEAAGSEDADLAAALRSCVLTIRFDEDELPTVQLPVGDFFGAVGGVHPYRTLTQGAGREGTMYSNWVMPYQRQAVLGLENLGGQALRITGRVLTDEARWPADAYRFHAGWVRAEQLPTRPLGSWSLLETEGPGMLAGLATWSRNPSRHGWRGGALRQDWGAEGAYASTTLDHALGFGGFDPGAVSHAYAAQIRDEAVFGADLSGESARAREWVMDCVPFDDRLQMSVDVRHRGACELDLAATVYWYAAPGAEAGLPRVAEVLDPAMLRFPASRAEPERRVPGAIEGEALPPPRVSSGLTAHPTDREGLGLSGGMQLTWVGGNPGDELELAFEAGYAARYRLKAGVVQAPDAGRFRVFVNGVETDPLVDLYAPVEVAGLEMDLGVFELAAGRNTMRWVIEGHHESASPAFVLGLDYLLAIPELSFQVQAQHN